MFLDQEYVPHCNTLPLSVNKGIREISPFKLTNKYATTRKNMKEWIKIVRVSLVKPVKGDQRAATGNARYNLKRRVSCTTCAVLAAHNKDTAIGQNKCGRIPTSTLVMNSFSPRNCTCRMLGTSAYLQLEVGRVFLPFICAINARRTIRCIKTDAERRSLRPAANIEDTRGLVRKYESTRAPHVRLDMHCAPSMVKIVGETQVEFVCTSRILELRRAELLEERDLAVFTDGCKQRRYETRDEVLCRIAL